MGITKHISIRVPEEIVIAADEVAKIKDRSRAYILVGVLQEWADKKDGGCMAVQKSAESGGVGWLMRRQVGLAGVAGVIAWRRVRSQIGAVGACCVAG